MATIGTNERSEGGILITEMNRLFNENNWYFKEAIGELSVDRGNNKDKRAKKLFPDAIIFKDKKKRLSVMGWEFKEPDVSIDDEELYSNARDKANRLGTSAFVLWNFQYCKVFYRKENNTWSKKPDYFFDDISDQISTRQDVEQKEDVWKKYVKQILNILNQDLINQKYQVAPIAFEIGNYVSNIADVLTPVTAEYLENSTDLDLKKSMKFFVKNEQAELTEISSKLTNSYIAESFAKNSLIRWLNRIIFANLIRPTHNEVVKILVDFIDNPDLDKLATNFNLLTNKTDFYTILHTSDEEKYLPQEVINNLAEFCQYLWNIDFDNSFVSKVLEAIVSSTKRELMGLYTTPVPLASLLVELTLKTAEGNFADFTVGSGTIVKQIMNYLHEEGISQEVIHNHVWASDKYAYPLQVANFNMTSSDSLNMINLIFQNDVLDLNVGDKEYITDPRTGKKKTVVLPSMTAIISNLPFISSNNRQNNEKDLLDPILKAYKLNRRSDLYQGIILHLKQLLAKQSKARIGVITSNSWFKNLKKSSFFEVLNEAFDIETIVYSNVSRWFDNAAVVASLLVLAPKGTLNKDISFIGLNEDIRSSSIDHISDITTDLVYNIDHDIENNNSIYEINKYSPKEVKDLTNAGLSVEALFDDLSWFRELLDDKVLVPLEEFCSISRGTRTGNDKFFITDDLKTDPQDSIPYIKNIKEIDHLSVNKSKDYLFYATDSLEEISQDGRYKTLSYIKSFENTAIGIKQKQKTKNSKKKWYTSDDTPTYADFITALNAEKRWFWAKLNNRSAVNQRVIALTVIPEYVEDKELIHAILNSIISLYTLAGSGFGRAQGATDLTKDGVSRIDIPNINLISQENKKKILNVWKKLENKKITSIIDQLNDDNWNKFNLEVFKAFNLNEPLFNKVKKSFIKLINRRENIRRS